MSKPLIQRVDSVVYYVPDLDRGLAFYRDQLGHKLLWRTKTACGLRLAESTELVLQTEQQGRELDLMVDCVDAAALQIKEAGGKVIMPPFDISIGRSAVVEDPWGNVLVLLDYTKSSLKAEVESAVAASARTLPAWPA